MKSSPLITIITVTYNAAATVERTLRSVESQTYPRIEHLIIDGCSTDGTLRLIQRYIERNGSPSAPVSDFSSATPSASYASPTTGSTMP